jgi:Predicted metal-dependent hydrolase of the TIM-barrel fold
VFGLDKRKAERMILNHDPEKILFGSDCPWCGGNASCDYMNSLSLPSKIKEMILHKNAEKLIGIVK